MYINISNKFSPLVGICPLQIIVVSMTQLQIYNQLAQSLHLLVTVDVAALG